MKKRINFIERPQASFRRNDLDTWINRSFVIAVVMLLLSMLQINSSYSHYKRKAVGLNTEKLQVERLLAEWQSKAKSMADNHKDMGPIQDVLKNKILWSDAMKELSALVGRDVWLDKLQSSYQDKNRSIVVTGYATSQQKVTAFFADLESSYFFRNVMIKYSQRKPDFVPPLYEFQFTATIPPLDAKVANR